MVAWFPEPFERQGRITLDNDARSAETRADFPVLRLQQTRWHDNDHYGHVNNVVYYSYFDTAVNGYLMEATEKDIRDLPAVGLVVETSCAYFRPLSFPDQLWTGLAAERVGRTSVVYKLAVFREQEETPAAAGRFVHVYVDRATMEVAPIPAEIRAAVERLQ